ncbi:YaiI/YqxD family protein [Candidatus Uabimicrobium sp. HlEnr_7]|uniref:YaiI/YqxD family protein n=1 Tax=Candidatus Uabimicrobium helgolandensis TaxID=3095367 RepID=UPI003557FB97
MKIFIDADGCPVKKEVYRVAQRYELEVTLVANAWMKTPDWTEFILVNDDLDAADNWIAEHVEENDIVITADIPLASRCLNKEACVIGSRGRFFTDDNIGNALATRELQSQLRDAGIMTKGPAPLQKKDRSKFLQSLDLAIQKIRRKIAKGE